MKSTSELVSVFASVFDGRVCTLGEGVLWHPVLKQLFWFDIVGKKLLSNTAEAAHEWNFDEHVSAAGWIDESNLLIASETSLFRFNLEDASSEKIIELESDNVVTRSNDGRADPFGGFWIGTMGKKAEPDAGAIYRYYKGELRQLVAPVTIPNAICCAPDGLHAYYTDTMKGVIWRQALNKNDGWPSGEPVVFVDCTVEGVFPDGAVVDESGCLWNAQWGSSRVACYNPEGELVRTIAFPAEQVSCPAFGGEDMTTLFATTATENLPDEKLAQQTDAGKLFQAQGLAAKGQREHQVALA